MGTIDKAIELYRDVALKSGDDERQGLTEVLKLADIATAEDPKDPRAWNLLGLALLDTGKNEEAVTALEKAVKFKPNWGVALGTLATAYERCGRQKDSKKTLARSQAILKK